MKPDEVEAELEAIQPIFGAAEDLQRFCATASERLVQPELNALADKGRNHPDVERLAHDILAQAFGDDVEAEISRCGAIATNAVERNTAVLLLRLRYTIRDQGNDLFAEEIVPAGFRRERGELIWLDADEALQLMDRARPTTNLDRSARIDYVARMLKILDDRDDWYTDLVEQRRTELHDSHTRLRRQIGGRAPRVTPHPPPDILGCYVFVPDGSGDRQTR